MLIIQLAFFWMVSKTIADASCTGISSLTSQVMRQWLQEPHVKMTVQLAAQLLHKAYTPL